MDRINNVVNRMKLDFICLVETKSNSAHIHHFSTIPSNRLFGGIIALSNRSIGTVTLVAISRLALHVVISSRFETWILSTFYNSQALSRQKKMFGDLSLAWPFLTFPGFLLAILMLSLALRSTEEVLSEIMLLKKLCFLILFLKTIFLILSLLVHDLLGVTTKRV